MGKTEGDGLLGRYRKFVTNNVEMIGNVESSLRSLSYIIPGLFIVKTIYLILIRPIQ